MTRKDYVALAEALNKARVVENMPTAWIACVTRIADVLQTDNPRFDRERFVKACQGGKS